MQIVTVLGPIAPEELGLTQTQKDPVLNLKPTSHRLDAFHRR